MTAKRRSTNVLQLVHKVSRVCIAQNRSQITDKVKRLRRLKSNYIAAAPQKQLREGLKGGRYCRGRERDSHSSATPTSKVEVTEPVDIASVGRVSSPMTSVWPVHGCWLLRPLTRKVTSGLPAFALPLRVSSTPQYARFVNAPCRLLADDAFIATRLIRLAGEVWFAFLDSVVQNRIGNPVAFQVNWLHPKSEGPF